MLRPLAAVLITILMFAGVYGYTKFVDSVTRPPLQVQEAFSSDEYSVRITRTFDCVGDPDFDVAALLVRFRGEDVLRRTDNVPQHEIIEVKPLKNVVRLANELYISANVKPNTTDDWGAENSAAASEESSPTESILHAVRVQVTQGTKTIADQTLWQEAGWNSITGSVSFQSLEQEGDATDHVH